MTTHVKYSFLHNPFETTPPVNLQAIFVFLRPGLSVVGASDEAGVGPAVVDSSGAVVSAARASSGRSAGGGPCFGVPVRCQFSFFGSWDFCNGNDLSVTMSVATEKAMAHMKVVAGLIGVLWGGLLAALSLGMGLMVLIQGSSGFLVLFSFGVGLMSLYTIVSWLFSFAWLFLGSHSQSCCLAWRVACNLSACV